MKIREVEAKFRDFGLERTRLQMIHDLPRRQMLAVSGRFLMHMSFKDLAAEMNCPYNTAKANYRHGMSRIAYEMSKIEEIVS